jgi:HK97 family phage major capsid protein
MSDIELKDISTALESQARIFEEFKRKNDERLEAIEKKGHAPDDLTEQVNRLSEAMTKIDGDVLEIQKKAGRLNAGGIDEDKKAEFKSALDLWARKGDLSGLERKAINSQSDPEGGYLIIPEIDNMIDRVVPTISVFAGLCNNRTIGTARYTKMMKTSGMTATWPGDGNTSGETTEQQWAQINIDVYPIEVEPWVHNSTLEDAMIDLEMDVTDEAAISFAEGIGAALITGTGVGKPFGLLSATKAANSSYAWGKIGYIASGKSAAFASVAPADKLVDLQHSLKQQYRANATWMMSDATLGTARQMKDGSGQYYLWQPDPTGSFGGRILGNPVAVDDNMSAIGAASYSIAFGDFRKGYTFVRRRGVQLIRDPYTAKGKTKFNFTTRVGGGITNYESIKLMKFATS